MSGLMFALGQTKQKKKEENKVKETKANLKDVNITDTVEKEIRKDQHNRDQKWKADGRDQIKQNTNFDMARSLFGGGGPAPPADEPEEEYEQEPEPEPEEEVADEAEEDEEEPEPDDEEEEEEEEE